MAEKIPLTAVQIAASSLADATKCPQCGGNDNLVLQFTARRPFFRVIQNGQAQPEQYLPEVLTFIESLACGACAIRFVAVNDVEFETRKALIVAKQELARRDGPMESVPAMQVTVH